MYQHINYCITLPETKEYYLRKVVMYRELGMCDSTAYRCFFFPGPLGGESSPPKFDVLRFN